MTSDTPTSGNTEKWYDRDFSPVGVNLRDEDRFRQVQSEVGRLTAFYDGVKRADIYGMMLEFAAMNPSERPDNFVDYVQLQVAEKEGEKA